MQHKAEESYFANELHWRTSTTKPVDDLPTFVTVKRIVQHVVFCAPRAALAWWIWQLRSDDVAALDLDSIRLPAKTRGAATQSVHWVQEQVGATYTPELCARECKLLDGSSPIPLSV